MVIEENTKFIRYLKELTSWKYAEYVLSLEVLRDERDLADKVYKALDKDKFYNVLDFEAGWSENFWALSDEDRKTYEKAFCELT